MKTKTIALFALTSLLLTLNANAQDKPINAKESLIAYLNAGDIRDTKALDILMHKDYRVVFKDLAKNETSIINKDLYIEYIEKKIFGGVPREIVKIKLGEEDAYLASFFVITKSKSGEMISYFTLIKENDKWQVLQDLVRMK